MALYAEFGEEGPLAPCSLRRRAAVQSVPLACSLFVWPSAMFFAKSVLALLIYLPGLNEGRIIPSSRYVEGGITWRDLIALIILSLIGI